MRIGSYLEALFEAGPADRARICRLEMYWGAGLEAAPPGADVEAMAKSSGSTLWPLCDIMT